LEDFSDSSSGAKEKGAVWAMDEGLDWQEKTGLCTHGSQVPSSPVRVTRPLGFDLNDSYVPTEAFSQGEVLTKRTVLALADSRMNKDGKENSMHKSHGRGFARLAVPLKKSLLCNAAAKPRAPSTKKTPPIVEAPGRSVKPPSGGVSNLTIDEQAVALLMKAGGVTDGVDNGKPTDLARQQFGEKFVSVMDKELVEDLRSALGLQGAEGTDGVSVLAIDVEA
jgi:hypothetical protein